MSNLTVPENSRDFDIASVYVVDEDNDNYTCTVYTQNAPPDRQPFEIVNGILRTSLTVHNNCEFLKKKIFMFFFFFFLKCIILIMKLYLFII